MERVYRHERTNPVLRGLRFIGFIILGVIGAAFFAFIFGYLIMLLWNWLMPMLFGLTTITFWQAVAIAFLARLIFGGNKHGHDRSRNNTPRDRFTSRWKREFKKEHKPGDWRYFDDYWWDEGEKAYNAYMERRKEQEQKED